MINKSTNTLNIFDDFVIDRNLPKHKKDNTVSEFSTSFMVGGSGSISGMDMPRMMTPTGAPVQAFNLIAEWDTDPNFWDGVSYNIRSEYQKQLMNRQQLEHTSMYGNGFLDKLSARFMIWVFDKKYKKKPTRTVESFFVSLKHTKEELELLGDRLKHYKQLLKCASESGQTALEEKLIKEIEIIGAESKLYSINLKSVITEEQLVKFTKECKKGLRLDWIKNFTRLIPDKVLEAKKKCDEHKIFDNYVVLHYDPKNQNTDKTEKEKVAERERRKDPILFGVLNNCRKLYFVGDWIDEHCDLQFKDLVKVFGEKEIAKNEISSDLKLV